MTDDTMPTRLGATVWFSVGGEHASAGTDLTEFAARSSLGAPLVRPALLAPFTVRLGRA